MHTLRMFNEVASLVAYVKLTKFTKCTIFVVIEQETEVPDIIVSEKLLYNISVHTDRVFVIYTGIEYDQLNLDNIGIETKLVEIQQENGQAIAKEIARHLEMEEKKIQESLRQ